MAEHLSLYVAFLSQMLNRRINYLFSFDQSSLLAIIFCIYLFIPISFVGLFCICPTRGATQFVDPRSWAEPLISTDRAGWRGQ